MSRDLHHQISILIIQKAWGYVTKKKNVINLNSKEEEVVQTFGATMINPSSMEFLVHMSIWLWEYKMEVLVAL